MHSYNTMHCGIVIKQVVIEQRQTLDSLQQSLLVARQHHYRVVQPVADEYHFTDIHGVALALRDSNRSFYSTRLGCMTGRVTGDRFILRLVSNMHGKPWDENVQMMPLTQHTWASSAAGPTGMKQDVMEASSMWFGIGVVLTSETWG
jgi:hypothetical protein